MINRAISYIVFFIPPQVSNFTWAVAKHEQTFLVASSPLFSLFRDYTFFTVDISISVYLFPFTRLQRAAGEQIWLDTDSYQNDIKPPYDA